MIGCNGHGEVDGQRNERNILSVLLAQTATDFEVEIKRDKLRLKLSKPVWSFSLSMEKR